jgi:hypothetical protein
LGGGRHKKGRKPQKESRGGYLPSASIDDTKWGGCEVSCVLSGQLRETQNRVGNLAGRQGIDGDGDVCGAV